MQDHKTAAAEVGERGRLAIMNVYYTWENNSPATRAAFVRVARASLFRHDGEVTTSKATPPKKLTLTKRQLSAMRSWARAAADGAPYTHEGHPTHRTMIQISKLGVVKGTVVGAKIFWALTDMGEKLWNPDR
jgi:hypothetical protein